MTRALTALLCLLVAAGGGCHSSHPNPGMSVVVEGGGPFPAALAGRWQADRDGWEFVIDSDGRIVSAVLSLGRVRITPGQKTTMATRSGGEGVFEPGEWAVYYEPGTSQLTIKVAMDHVRVEMGDTVLEGSAIDILSGAVSTDEGIWQVQWSAFNKYTVEGAAKPAVDLSTHPDYGETKALTFQRISEQ
ncbi:MAG: hypothetical protein ACYTAS_23085 [Planctomycetota bacterium]|jgi:hypothetical protein